MERSETPVCNICMDEMKGNVTLKCGHELCPLCFAKHARIHHLCPFCRDEFAPASAISYQIMQQIPQIPRDVAESMATNSVQEYYYDSVYDDIEYMMETLDIESLKTSIYGFMYQTSMNVIQDIERWYNFNI